LLSSHVRLGTRQVFHPPATELGYSERPVAVTQRSSARYRHRPFRCCSSPVYILDGLLHNDSDIQPDTVHADTQGQSLPVYGLATLLGFDLLPRIRNWHDLIFYRPDAATRYRGCR
jgi:TnpA family transposase